MFVFGQLFADSDFRLKKNITPLTDALEKLKQIHGVSFEWNDVAASLGHSVRQRGIGVLAQDVESVFPELVANSSTNGYKAVDYGRLTAVLIEAVKELKSEKDLQITALKAGNDNQQKQIAALEVRLAELEKVIKMNSAHNK